MNTPYVLIGVTENDPSEMVTIPHLSQLSVAYSGCDDE
jgi:hypothetical protein